MEKSVEKLENSISIHVMKIGAGIVLSGSISLAFRRESPFNYFL